VNQGLWAVFGALAAGVPQLLTAWIQRGTAKAQREHERMEKEAQRQHEEAERNAQREHARRAAVLAEHARRVREWREGLAASHREYEEWAAEQKAAEGRPPSMGRPQPNIVSAVWFQSLRHYLPPNGQTAWLSKDDDIQCESFVADVLSSEITRIEQEWLKEENG
jgi:hypothetical protein